MSSCGQGQNYHIPQSVLPLGGTSCSTVPAVVVYGSAMRTPANKAVQTPCLVKYDKVNLSRSTLKMKDDRTESGKDSTHYESGQDERCYGCCDLTVAGRAPLNMVVSKTARRRNENREVSPTLAPTQLSSDTSLNKIFVLPTVSRQLPSLSSEQNGAKRKLKQQKTFSEINASNLVREVQRKHNQLFKPSSNPKHQKTCFSSSSQNVILGGQPSCPVVSCRLESHDRLFRPIKAEVASSQATTDPDSVSEQANVAKRIPATTSCSSALVGSYGPPISAGAKFDSYTDLFAADSSEVFLQSSADYATTAEKSFHRSNRFSNDVLASLRPSFARASSPPVGNQKPVFVRFDDDSEFHVGLLPVHVPTEIASRSPSEDSFTRGKGDICSNTLSWGLDLSPSSILSLTPEP